MQVPFLSRRKRDYVIAPLRRADAKLLPPLHREDFARPWSAAEFDALIAQETVFGFTARPVSEPNASPAGFVLARVAAGEAEILTVAVARAHRRGGLGRALMDAVLRSLHTLRAEALFLEVDATNVAALALYRRLGFREVGRRPGYYGEGLGRTDAVVMRRDI